MNKQDICVAIPVYKPDLNALEIQSVKQCLIILEEYHMCFVVPDDLNLEFYKSHFKEITKYIRFDNHFFNSLQGYNSLLLSPSFYEKFEAYKYLLIHQTDCYVFKDDLLQWAKKGYDYIGGLLFEGFHGNPEQGAKLWCAGNGGLSLRRVCKFKKQLSSNKKLKNSKQLKAEKEALTEFTKLSKLKLNLLFLLKRMGYKNSIAFYAKTFSNNEDVFFIELCLDYNMMTMPEPEEAFFFSWDRRPDFLFNRYKELPFACHAWYRTDAPYENNKDFWQRIF